MSRTYWSSDERTSVTETGNAANSANNAGQDLATLKIPELRKIAADKGLKGVSGLRKGELIEAIKTGKIPAKQASGTPGEATAEDNGRTAPRRATRRATSTAKPQKDTESNDDSQKAETTAPAEVANNASKTDSPDSRDNKPAQAADSEVKESSPSEQDEQGEQRYESRSAARRARRNRARNNNDNRDNSRDEQREDSQSDNRDNSRDDNRGSNRNDNTDKRQNSQGDNRNDNRDGDNAGERDDERGNNNSNNRSNNRDNNNRDGGDGGGRRGRRGRRNRRGRDNRGGDNQNQNQNQNQDLDPEELQEVAGIVDIVDNNAAFVRTTGYRANPADVFVSNQLVRRFGLRSGDAIIGQVRQNGQGQSHGSGRNRHRYNQLVRVDSINGLEPEKSKERVDFHKLTPLYPNQRLRLETEPNILTTRVIDLVMPIGKGQRALIVSPPKAGKTTILQNIANAISTNNPECYLMVVLVDERPEEVTDMQRSVKGEVIASTFDRPPSEHTAVAELAIERAKRLVEMGQDVVVLLDSITRLGRAYNNSSPASGRILSGGVDSNALYPPKRFLGAARNIEDGGSLTIIATAMVETGSAGDTVIFEEFKGTGNAELKLDRKISERRVFPAVDVNPSGTRKDELLLVQEEARIMHKLRRILSALDSQAAIDLLIKQLKKTKSNGEFLMQVAQSAPMAADTEPEDYI
ncbi:transcription termination factor Rho [Corynebacterium breve]|uniref:Transcription termination factor Rho n=1 Tax=Corynebacterium breve TaxID=3049799 RepID=A0ABY8VG43_9CORY|nr:transcription termination factor Rho [Corynebacterium breve]WIM68626.1 transcription termination factor Rho [Corynebacterium breve]